MTQEPAITKREPKAGFTMTSHSIEAIFAGRKVLTSRIPSAKIMEKVLWHNGVPQIEKWLPYKAGDFRFIKEHLWKVDSPLSMNWPCFLYDEEFRLYQEDGWSRKQPKDFWISRVWEGDNGKFGSLSPVFMPAWAARIFYKIEEIKILRLGDFTEQDYIDEGCPQEYLLGVNWFRPHWEKINGKGSYDPKLWVSQIRFRLVGKDGEAL